MKTTRRPILAGAIALIAIVGCDSDPDDAAKTETAGQPVKTAEKSGSDSKTAEQPAAKKPERPAVGRKFTVKDYKAAKKQLRTFCVTCHGKTGKGDGPASVPLNPKPRNWTDAKWQASVTDEQIFKVIKLGGEKNGLSPFMAPNPMYQDRPGVMHALVKLVRGFQGK